MDRKITPKPKEKYSDIPPRQRWLYHMSDYGVGKLLLYFFAICWIALGLTFLIVKIILRIHK